MQLANIIMVAVIVEALITYGKAFVVDRSNNWEYIFSASIGIVLSLAYQLDLLATLGMESRIPVVGMVLTGILISRGSNFVWDIWQKLLQARSE